MQGKRILLGVTGGIAAYKSPDLVRRLRERGAEVQVVMTAAAARVRHRDHLPGGLRAPRAQRAVGRGGRGCHGPHRTCALGRCGADRAGNGRLPRAPCGRPGRRPAHDAVPCDPGAGGRRAGDEPRDVGERGDARQRRDRWRRAASRIFGPGDGDQACGESGPGRMLEPLDLADARSRAPAWQRRAGRPSRADHRRPHPRADRPGALRQ